MGGPSAGCGRVTGSVGDTAADETPAPDEKPGEENWKLWNPSGQK